MRLAGARRSGPAHDYQVLLHSTCEYEPGRIRPCSRVPDRVVARLTFQRDCPAREILHAGAHVEPGLGLGLPKRLAVVLEPKEVRTDAGANEGMPLATLPVVVDVEPQRNLTKRIGRLTREARIGQSEVRPQAYAWREVVLEQRAEDERVVEFTLGGNERANVETDRGRTRMRCAFLSRRDARPHDARTDDEDTKETFEHLVPP